MIRSPAEERRMSTATADPPVTKPLSPVEYVRRLAVEDREAVLLSLIEDVYQMSGRAHPIPLRDESGRSLGVLVPPNSDEARWQAMLAEMPPDVRESMTRTTPAGFDPERCLTDEQMAQLRQQVYGQSP
jgi:hypothetical protein